ncbi:NAD(P)-dependent oxidoreductase [Castellaniella sp.]|uniref:NAD-dependent epimerase/dehydratase family protein n=1 Tax=Castellaniella sp. TaxID=1955812 RepID=UPI0025C6E0B7|nr:NAD(P)-dependent oxidoreductase [Castellaniella sp.]
MVGNKFERILLTGAAGGLGRVLRETLKPMTRILRLSDIQGLGKAGPSEELCPCDLSDRQAVSDLVRDCDAIVHMGGVSVERPFEEILEANIKGIFHIYEAAREHGARRVVFASSNHAIGFYRQTERLDARAPTRPDGYYGLSKVYGEAMASFYHDRYGIETISIRIGSCFPEPKDRRMMHIWLSAHDLTELIRRGLFTPEIGHTIIFGMSDNKETWWDNRLAAHIGFQAQDTSEAYRDMIEKQPMPAADDPTMVYQGGAFTAQGPFEPVRK